MSVQTNEVKETMDTPSSEGLIVHLDVSVLYHLDATKAPEVYRSIGLNYESVLVTPNVRSAVREVTSSYEAKALYSPEREKMSSEINQHVHDRSSRAVSRSNDCSCAMWRCRRDCSRRFRKN